MKSVLLLIAVVVAWPLSMLKAQTAEPTTVSSDQMANPKEAKGDVSGIVDVDQFTGIGRVGIPLHSYQIDGLSLNTSLSYSCKGVQVEQNASEVGLGWDLAVGGSIERRVMGDEDELFLPRPAATGPYPPGVARPQNILGKFINPSLFQAADIQRDLQPDIFMVSFAGRSFECNPFGFGTSTSPRVRVRIEVLYNRVNQALSSNNTTDAVITSTVGPQFLFNSIDSNWFLSFRITDEKGNQFLFTRGDYEKRRTQYPSPSVNFDYFVTTRWVLKKITTYSGQEISYEYIRFDESKFSQRVEKVRECQGYTDGGNSYIEPKIELLELGLDFINGVYSYQSAVRYPNHEVVEFIYEDDNNRRRCDALPCLRRIRVSQQFGDVTKAYQYSLNHSYLNANTSQGQGFPTDPEIAYNAASPCESLYPNAPGLLVHRWRWYELRLLLNSIDRIGYDGATTEKYYSFEYNSTRLPGKNSPSRDFYGYFNGKSPVLAVTAPASAAQFQHLANLGIPLHTYTEPVVGYSVTYGVDRTEDTVLKKAAILTSITNGMNGRISLFYKSCPLQTPAYLHSVDMSHHPYVHYLPPTPSNPNPPAPPPPYLPVSTDYLGGSEFDGLSVDRLVFTDGYNHGNDFSQVYEYEEGQRFLPGLYFDVPEFIIGPQPPPYDFASAQPSAVAATVYWNRQVSPSRFLFGSNHGFSKVSVRRYGASNMQMDQTVSRFTNAYNYQTGQQNLEFDAYQTADRNRLHQFIYTGDEDRSIGLLTSLSKSDALGHAVSRDSFVYSRFALYSGTEFQELHSVSHVTTNRYNFLSRADFRPAKKLSTLFATQGSSNSELTYQYDDSDNLRKVVYRNSKGERLTQLRYYNYTPGLPVATTLPTATKFLVLTELWKGEDGSSILLSATHSNAVHNSQMGITRYFSNSQLKSPAAPPVAFSPAGLHKQLEVEMFDWSGNVVGTGRNGNAEHEAGVWDTRTGRKVASVQNCIYTDMACTSFEGLVAPYGTPDDNKANWDYDPDAVVTDLVSPHSVTGHAYFVFGTHGSAPTPAITSTRELSAGKHFILSFWASDLPDVSYNGSAVNMVQRDQVGPWKLFTGSFVAATGGRVAVSAPPLSSASEDIRLDELRLHPAEAAMRTAAYEPLIGMSSDCDEQNNIRYYEYDAMGRLKVVRDIQDNILSVTQQVVNGPDN